MKSQGKLSALRFIPEGKFHFILVTENLRALFHALKDFRFFHIADNRFQKSQYLILFDLKLIFVL